MIIFLINQGFVEFEKLVPIALDALTYARAFDLQPTAVREHLRVVKAHLPP